MRLTCADSIKKTAFVLAVVLLGTGCQIKDPIFTVHPVERARTATEDRRQCIQEASNRLTDQNTIDRKVTIERPVGSVYEFYRDFRNLPKFLGDVMNIEQTGPATSRWTIQGPLHIQTLWRIKVTEDRTNESICYETVGSPGLKTYWEIYFSPGRNPGQTEVREVLRSPLGGIGRAALALIGKFPAEEVAANLHRLKQVMETGRVTDTSYSVTGKFERTND
jgi:uncharacterized membrane protein